MRIALGMAVLPGLGTGLVLVGIAGLGLPTSAGWPQLAQAHGQLQALGFVLLFIVAVGLQLFPRIPVSPLVRAERAVWGASVLAAAQMWASLEREAERWRRRQRDGFADVDVRAAGRRLT